MVIYTKVIENSEKLISFYSQVVDILPKDYKLQQDNKIIC